MRSTVPVLLVAMMAGVLVPGADAAPQNGKRGSNCKPSQSGNSTYAVGIQDANGTGHRFNGTGHGFNCTGHVFNETGRHENDKTLTLSQSASSSSTVSVSVVASSSVKLPTSSVAEISVSVSSSVAASSSDIGNVLAATSAVASSTEAVATSAVSSSSAASPTQSSSSSSGGVGAVSDLDPKELLTLHNDYRAKHGAHALTWNDTLASYATNWGLGCHFAHSHGPYGENLAANQGDAASLFKLWTDESSDYDPSNPQYSHFTQVVWKGTTKLGCALITCPDGTIFTIGRASTYLVCEYGPAGNVIGQFAENVQA